MEEEGFVGEIGDKLFDLYWIEAYGKLVDGVYELRPYGPYQSDYKGCEMLKLSKSWGFLRIYVPTDYVDPKEFFEYRSSSEKELRKCDGIYDTSTHFIYFKGEFTVVRSYNEWFEFKIEGCAILGERSPNRRHCYEIFPWHSMHHEIFAYPGDTFFEIDSIVGYVVQKDGIAAVSLRGEKPGSFGRNQPVPGQKTIFRRDGRPFVLYMPTEDRMEPIPFLLKVHETENRTFSKRRYGDYRFDDVVAIFNHEADSIFISTLGDDVSVMKAKGTETKINIKDCHVVGRNVQEENCNSKLPITE